MPPDPKTKKRIAVTYVPPDPDVDRPIQDSQDEVEYTRGQFSPTRLTTDMASDSSKDAIVVRRTQGIDVGDDITGGISQANDEARVTRGYAGADVSTQFQQAESSVVVHGQAPHRDIALTDGTPSSIVARPVAPDARFDTIDGTPNSVIVCPAVLDAVIGDVQDSPSSIVPTLSPRTITIDNTDASPDALTRTISVAPSAITIGEVESSQPVATSSFISPEPVFSPIEPAEDEQIVDKQFSFTGAWYPKGDALAIGEENYTDIQNFRYTDFGIEGVGGHTRINARAPYNASGVLSIRNAIQYFSFDGDESYVIAQLNHGDDSYIVKSNSVIPSTGYFDWWYIKDGINSALRVTSSESGAYETVQLNVGMYTDPQVLAATIDAVLNANVTLTGGVITFATTYSEATQKFTIDAGVGNTLALAYTSSTAAETIGFTADTASAQTITSDITVSGLIVQEESAAGVARMALLPRANLGICDTKKNYIWGGEERNPDSVLHFFAGGLTEWTGAYAPFVRDWNDDYTEKVTNSLSSTFDDYIYFYGYSSNQNKGHAYLVGSTRPICAVYFDIITAADGSNTLTCQYYKRDTGAWTNVSASTDGTASMTQSGWFTIDEELDDTPYLVNGKYLFFYRFVLSATAAITGTCKVAQIKVRNRTSELLDIWDGTLRTAIAAGRYDDSETSNKFKDYTLEVADESFSDATEMMMTVPKMTTSDYIEVIFSEPMAGLYIKMGEKINTAVYALKWQYWSAASTSTTASGFSTAASVKRDTTQSITGSTLSNDGYVLFDNQTLNSETRVTLRGVTGYAYRLFVTGTLSAEISIDTIRGIPKHRTIRTNYAFPFKYGNRAMWCGSLSDNELNRIDYSMSNAPDVYNGTDASGTFNERSLYIGEHARIRCATELFNQYGSSVDSVALILKDNETYMLTGSSPENFAVNKISGSIGCQAPFTLVTAETAYPSRNVADQNIALWVSSTGPVAFIGNTIMPIKGVEPYFDPSDSVNYIKSFEDARGWFDPIYKEYNLVFQNQASANVWIVYDIIRDKWYKKTPTSDHPTGGLQVHDTSGNKYVYGYTSTGYLTRMDYGLVWGTGYGITGIVETAEILPANSVWYETTLQRLKTIYKDNSPGVISISHYLNGETTNTVSPTTFTASSTAKTFTITGATFTLGSIRQGCKVVVSGSVDNDRAFTVVSYTSTVLTLLNTDTVANETGTASVTLTFYPEYQADMDDPDSHRFRGLITNMNSPGWTHRLKFTTTSCSSTKPVLLGWSGRFAVTREETLDSSNYN